MSEPAEQRPSNTDVVRLGARAFERDRYLAALLAPHGVRDDLIALAAFAGEPGPHPKRGEPADSRRDPIAMVAECHRNDVCR